MKFGDLGFGKMGLNPAKRLRSALFNR